MLNKNKTSIQSSLSLSWALKTQLSGTGTYHHRTILIEVGWHDWQKARYLSEVSY